MQDYLRRALTFYQPGTTRNAFYRSLHARVTRAYYTRTSFTHLQDTARSTHRASVETESLKHRERARDYPRRYRRTTAGELRVEN